MVFVVISVAVTFAMCFTCTMFYMGSAPDLDITGLVKKAMFMVFSFCNSITMLASVATVMHLIWAYHLSDFEQIQTALIRAMAHGTCHNCSYIYVVCICDRMLSCGDPSPMEYLFHISLITSVLNRMF